MLQRISKEQLMKIFEVQDEDNWSALIWYLTDRVLIEKYDDKGIEVKGEQGSRIKEDTKLKNDFCEEMEAHNFEVDCSNDLFYDHKKGYELNPYVINQIMRDYRKKHGMDETTNETEKMKCNQGKCNGYFISKRGCYGPYWECSACKHTISMYCKICKKKRVLVKFDNVTVAKCNTKHANQYRY